jgi:hypothetical protein
MSKAWDIYKTIGQWGPLASDNNPRALELLKSAAAEWRAAGRYFSAAYVMNQALHVAVVLKDASIDAYLETCLDDCQRCIDVTIWIHLKRLQPLIYGPGYFDTSELPQRFALKASCCKEKWLSVCSVYSPLIRRELAI